MTESTYTTNTSVFMIVGGNWNSGNLEIPTFVRSQAESLRSSGWKVSLGIVDDRTSVRGILRNIQKLAKQIAEVGPAVVHAQYGSVTAAVGNMIRGKLPLVVSFCGDDLLGTPQPGIGWRIREASARHIGLWAAQHAAAIIIKSKNLHNALPKSLRPKAKVLPNGVDTSLFKLMAREECRDKLGWSRHSKVVLFNGSKADNQSSKNPALARATIDHLSKSVPDISLHLLSNTNHLDVPIIMNAADCLLVTSLHEGSPNIVKEAMACNLPVVSVPCGDVEERLNLTHPGSVCPYDAKILARAVQNALESTSRSNGRDQLIAQGLTAASVAQRLIQTYQRVQEKTFSLQDRAA